MTLTDPFGRILTEIRDDPGVTAITTRIRPVEPAEGDAQGAGHYLPFVVIVRLSRTRLPHASVQEHIFIARCYAATYPLASALARAVSEAIHNRGHRISGAGVAIFGSYDEGGGEQERDPDTGQPLETLMFSVGASTAPIA